MSSLRQGRSGADVGDFAGGVRSRVRHGREALRAAQESGDQHGAHVLAADLEEMLRLAAEHGVAVDGDGDGGEPLPPSAPPSPGRRHEG
ncbi:hypothetical protein GBF35_14035 [Nonomuraea phyllanthi]|uniref:hypothetical protein n=1 Tax=Nonomuraea phyllanthi TaxID=2219224 RepID=UPI001293B767|nr:hypothetical protein [Nonomuraea phyllanthi]QFY07658.1 hypothetical protein GBF35_14035 [Nonomuraea phyllanthi]